MKISFTTKKESNAVQRNAFLKLTHSERFDAWLTLIYRTNQLMGKQVPENDNFIINIPRD